MGINCHISTGERRISEPSTGCCGLLREVSSTPLRCFFFEDSDADKSVKLTAVSFFFRAKGDGKTTPRKVSSSKLQLVQQKIVPRRSRRFWKHKCKVVGRASGTWGSFCFCSCSDNNYIHIYIYGIGAISGPHGAAASATC